MTALLDRAGLAALVPHAGAMCLWDELLAADETTVHVRTRRHADADHPLRRDGRLAALHLIEYGAQAMAVHGGWLAKTADGAGGARPGVLAAVRDLALHVERIDDLAAPLECSARRLVANAGGWMYEFRLHAGERTLATGRASVILAT
ncbi:hypothetical protein [Solimonas variicoloris]|uniref:hypothetical protein n=1 Tax=Solimonas variicoloris TaxID=254408 RepID=UPI000368C8FD|nr:hypothetical protein [Solimonas variicoloris]